MPQLNASFGQPMGGPVRGCEVGSTRDTVWARGTKPEGGSGMPDLLEAVNVPSAFTLYYEFPGPASEAAFGGLHDREDFISESIAGYRDTLHIASKSLVKFKCLSCRGASTAGDATPGCSPRPGTRRCTAAAGPRTPACGYAPGRSGPRLAPGPAVASDQDPRSPLPPP